MRLWLALRAFIQVLFDKEFAESVQQIQLNEPPKLSEEPVAQVEHASPKPPVRSEAMTLLATLQREARFVDMVSESLDAYSDAQVGAAARDVLRDCGQVVERLFGLEPVAKQPEGQPIEVPHGYDAALFRLVGQVGGEPPLTGTLQHAGWKATRCELPQWSGSDESALVVAPAEVQVG